MKTVFLLFDSLNYNALEAFGATHVHTPNSRRLAERAVRFDRHWAGSLPCMPARRDLHTGRLNFLHRSWGPLEPFDTSMVSLLQKAGVYTHLVSDHYHYFEEGGATYHTQYGSFEFVRGQESDQWKAMVQPPLERFRQQYHAIQTRFEDRRYLPNLVNREFIRDETDYPIHGCFESAFEFLEGNRAQDGWLLHLECFDPHEPFTAPAQYRERYPTQYRGPVLDWPMYARVKESPEEVAELRANYAALVTMCDTYLGKLLDYFDRHDLWRDTALVLTTDHGFLLGEHDWWAKNRMPMFNEIAHLPLMVYHPDYAHLGGQRIDALTQTPDLMCTLLDFHGHAAPPSARGKSLRPLLEGATRHHDAVLYGMFGSATNITDGRYTYFRYPEDMVKQELYEYTLMPTHLRSFFSPATLREAQLVRPFDFTQEIPVLKVPARRLPDGRVNPMGTYEDTTTLLFDLEGDPHQLQGYRDAATEERLLAQMTRILGEHDAPAEAYTRIGLPAAAAGATR
jgi:arylsulfatase A-like enzyme